MNRTALIIAAHGSGDGSSINCRVRSVAGQIADTGRFDEVVAAFRLGRPGFADVLDTVTADECVVVPLMAADGHFSNVVLPDELGKCAHSRHMSLRISPPVGAHSAILAAVRDRIGRVMDRHQLPRHDTTVVVVGHGTPRHGAGRRATELLACDVSDVCSQSLAVHLDESPRLEDAHRRIHSSNVIVIPFVIGGGHHAVQDIPARIDAGLSSNGGGLPLSRERFVVCDVPVGEYDVIPDVIVALATAESAGPRLVGWASPASNASNRCRAVPPPVLARESLLAPTTRPRRERSAGGNPVPHEPQSPVPIHR
ncbi:MAG: hypothetical protein HOP29_06905 [Phycisphaerales bacterium]|nr:hypothetical protein [Phycisphaerales bacterium]